MKRKAKDVSPGDVVVWRDGSQHEVQKVSVVYRGAVAKVNIIAGVDDETGVEWAGVSGDTLIEVVEG